MTFQEACKTIKFSYKESGQFYKNQLYWFQREFVEEFINRGYFRVAWTKHQNHVWFRFYSTSAGSRLWGGGCDPSLAPTLKFLFQKRLRTKYVAWLKIQQ